MAVKIPLADFGEKVALLNDVAFHHLDRDGALVLGDHGDLHLHGLKDEQGVPVLHRVPVSHNDLPDVGDHFRADLGHDGSSHSSHNTDSGSSQARDYFLARIRSTRPVSYLPSANSGLSSSSMKNGRFDLGPSIWKAATASLARASAASRSTPNTQSLAISGS